MLLVASTSGLAEDSKNNLPQSGSHEPGHRPLRTQQLRAERGQVVIPKQARDDYKIRPGDRLLVVGNVRQDFGITLVKAEAMKKFAEQTMGAVGRP